MAAFRHLGAGAVVIDRRKHGLRVGRGKYGTWTEVFFRDRHEVSFGCWLGGGTMERSGGWLKTCHFDLAAAATAKLGERLAFGTF